MGDWWSEEIVQSAVVNQKLTDGVEHPAPFPEKIVILPVLQTTNEGDLVLDPFCGSMTTGKVSERFNRQFVGYDVQVYWVESTEIIPLKDWTPECLNEMNG